MPIHHVVLRTPDPATLAGFYCGALGVPEVRRNTDPAGLYSVWLDLDGAILMIERGARPVRDCGWDGLFFAVPTGSGDAVKRAWARLGIPLEAETSFTLYARDPDGNRFGVSSFPLALAPTPAPG